MDTINKTVFLIDVLKNSESSPALRRDVERELRKILDIPESGRPEKPRKKVKK